MKLKWEGDDQRSVCKTETGQMVGGTRKTNAGDYVWQVTIVGMTIADTEKEHKVAKERVEKAALAALGA